MSYARDAHLTTIVTTEHFTLQAARAATISQATGRAGIYLTALSSSLIALAFMRQIAEPDVVFRIFGLVVLVPLAVLGFATFERTLQLALEDVGYARRINRLRRFYFRSGIDLADYLVTPIGDDDQVAILQQAESTCITAGSPFCYCGR